MTLIKAVWRWLCRKRTAFCSSNRLHFSHKVNYSNTGVYNFLPNAAGVSWDWCRLCPLCLVNGSPVFVLLKIVHTYRKKHCRWFPNDVSRMSSGKILATVLNVRSVRIDDQFKTFIFECSQYWQFMTSMAPIQYKTYICGMFCCYLLLYINIFFSGDSSDSICWSGGPWCRLHLPIKLGTLHERSVNILYLQGTVNHIKSGDRAD